MARREKRAQPAAQLQALLDGGDWRSAGAEARRILADPASGEPEREAAREAERRLRPEPAAVAVGLFGLGLMAVAVVLGLLLR